MLRRPGHPLTSEIGFGLSWLDLIPVSPGGPILGRFAFAASMGLLDHTIRILGLSETILKWQGAITELSTERREKVAQYAEQIAATLARAAAAFSALEKDPANARAGREAVRELGRIAGYIEDIVRALEDHLDGRKLAGVKRRLELLTEKEPIRAAARKADAQRVERLLEAEGYFRALADGLRT